VNEDETDRYRLSERENQRIFREQIVRHELSGPRPQRRPTAVFLVGQPGAGKTALGSKVAERLEERGGFVEVDSDLYKPYHPQYRELMARDDTLMARYTAADGRAWMAQTQQHVREHRLNAVIHETAQNPEYLAGQMDAYRRAGYRVEVAVMGVSEAASNQGIVNRYHEQARTGRGGRLTVQEKADLSYKGIPEMAQLIDDRRLAHQVEVYRRDETTPRYRNKLDEQRRWQQPPRLRAAVEAERARPWNATERAGFTRTQAKLRREMGPGWKTRLDRIDRLARPHLARTNGADPRSAARLQARHLRIRRRTPAARTFQGRRLPVPIPRLPVARQAGADQTRSNRPAAYRRAGPER